MHGEHFRGIAGLRYEGSASREPLSFKHYEAEACVEGKPMADHLRFAACYWHTMRNGLEDPFGTATAVRPWDDLSSSLGNAKRRADAFFEFLTKCRIGRWCFHDRDLAPEGNTIAQSEANLDALVQHASQLQAATGVQLLWGTANLFSHPRYMQGAASSPHLDAFLHAAAQVRKALEVTHALGGSGYVLWGGREGYTSLLHTDMAREREHLARFLHMVADHARAIGFEGALFIEPKPHEPTTHQYDHDAEATLNFLREFGLTGTYTLNIETNHATLAGHSMAHELEVARAAGALGSIDANMGTPGLGWDTDRFPTDVLLTTHIMLAVLEQGGLKHGGLNFDAKRRRESYEPIDLFHAHVAGMDAFALGLRIAARLRADGRLAAFKRARYESWESELGQSVARGDRTLVQCAHAAAQREATLPGSGRQELLESIVNDVMVEEMRSR